MPKVAKARPKKKNGYKMPEPLPNGEIVVDITKKKWRLGPSIGKGGFGEIYSAQDASDTSKKNKYQYVVKIEPHANGPLFVEMHFFMRNAKQADIEEFKALRKLPSLGMPVYMGSGSHEHGNEKFRFIVMEKFGSDIWKIFLKNKKKFPAHTVFKIGIQILDILEYIHSKGYVHADVKGANILLDLNSDRQVYLVDFGLSGHYFTGKEFKPDAKKAHNGTIEYLSRDAHLGVQTRRGDIEVLAYNLVHWLGCTLPWENNLEDPVSVQQSKEKHMADIPGFMKICFGNATPPNAIVDFLKYINTMKFDTEPDYKKLRKLLLSGLTSAGGSLNTPIQFTIAKSPGKRKSDTELGATPGKKPRKSKKKVTDNDLDEKENVEVNKVVEAEKVKTKKRGRTPKRKESIDEDGDDLVEDNEDSSEPEDKPRGKKPPRKATNKEEDDVVSDVELNGYVSETNSENDDNDILVPVAKNKKVATVVKRRGRKAASKEILPKDVDVSDAESNGYTAEMKRIKSRIEATKLAKVNKTRVRKQKSDEDDVIVAPSTSGATSTRNRRNRKDVNYQEDDESLKVTTKNVIAND